MFKRYAINLNSKNQSVKFMNELTYIIVIPTKKKIKYKYTDLFYFI